MFKMADPHGILCKSNKLNNARACLRHLRRHSKAIPRKNGASVFAKFFRYRAPATCRAIAGTAHAGGSNSSHEDGLRRP